jgi:DNA primase
VTSGGKIPKSVIDEIKLRVDVVALIGEHVPLKKTGSGYKGCCPFHDEKTPSFHVSSSKRMFHCFGCGEGGDVFAFLMKKNGLSFPEVLDDLAGIAGIDLAPYRSQDAGPSMDRGDFYTANRAAAEFFQNQLKRNERAQGYLQSRGLDGVTRDAFTVGYAPDDWSRLLDHMREAGFDLELLADIGLIKRRKESSGYYDTFRDRLMFPIRDEHSRIVAFGGRRVGDSDAPKYVNSPESPLYTKGQHLYNLDRALRELQAKETDTPILCEGYMDVIAFFRAGVRAAVANLGTALTRHQANRMARVGKRWVLAFDSDTAGMRAAVKAIKILDPLGVDCRVLDLSGKDPDEVLENEGAKVLQRAVERARPVDEFLFDTISRTHDLSAPQGRSEAFRELREIFQVLENPVLKQGLIRQISDGLSLSEELVQQAFKRSSAGQRATQEIAMASHRGELPLGQRAERTILREILQDVSFYRSGAAGVLSAGLARDPFVKRVLLRLDEIEVEEGPVFDEVLEGVEEESLARFLRGLEFEETPAGGEEAEQRILDCLQTLEEDSVRTRFRMLQREIRDCRDDPGRRRELTMELSLVSKQLNELQTRRAS